MASGDRNSARRNVAAKSAYSAKLLDPRWQKLRLQILERDGWACRICFSDSLTLHVHHAIYSDGEPWGVPASWLVTLCFECHEKEHEEFRRLWHSLRVHFANAGIITSSDLDEIDARIVATTDASIDPNIIAMALSAFSYDRKLRRETQDQSDAFIDARGNRPPRLGLD